MLVHINILTNVDMIKSGVREIELIYDWRGHILSLSLGMPGYLVFDSWPN